MPKGFQPERQLLHLGITAVCDDVPECPARCYLGMNVAFVSHSEGNFRPSTHDRGIFTSKDCMELDLEVRMTSDDKRQDR
jgi:hypothetical protein